MTTIEFMPVDNGNMVLITTESQRKILTDINIRNAADVPNVAKMLRDRLPRDSHGRLFVDVLLVSHPDQDHVCGLREHFHLGELSTWSSSEDRIIIREMWSSPIIFRRKSRVKTLTDDAMAWWTEARRRVQAYRDGRGIVDGNRILVIGEDIDHKTDGIEAILVRTGQTFNTICGAADPTLSVDLLAPLPTHNDEDEEEKLATNRSSVIARFNLNVTGRLAPFRYLSTGDAEVLIWEKLWAMHKSFPSALAYDLLQVPHHCSIHSLSWDSWSDKGGRLLISTDARRALSQAYKGATLVASCRPITPQDGDPPCVRAEQEYQAIAREVSGKFLGTMTHQASGSPDVLRFEIRPDQEQEPKSVGSIRERLTVPSTEFQKRGDGRYA